MTNIDTLSKLQKSQYNDKQEMEEAMESYEFSTNLYIEELRSVIGIKVGDLIYVNSFPDGPIEDYVWMISECIESSSVTYHLEDNEEIRIKNWGEVVTSGLVVVSK